MSALCRCCSGSVDGAMSADTIAAACSSCVR
jgi:hypothetical protein